MPHWKSIAFCAAVSYVSVFMAGPIDSVHCIYCRDGAVGFNCQNVLDHHTFSAPLTSLLTPLSSMSSRFLSLLPYFIIVSLFSCIFLSVCSYYLFLFQSLWYGKPDFHTALLLICLLSLSVWKRICEFYLNGYLYEPREQLQSLLSVCSCLLSPVPNGFLFVY